MFMLCHRCALGGAEKRYARVFEMLCASDAESNHKLIINRAMLDLLHSANILTKYNSHISVLDPPSTQFQFIKQVRMLHLAIDSLWYVWQCWRTILTHRSAIFHPLLTAVHYCLPTFLVLRNRRLMLSAYSYQFANYRDKSIFGIQIGAMLKRLMMRRANAIDALSGSIRDDLIERGIDAQKIHVAPNSFTDLTNCRSTERKEKWVAFVGRFEEIKNPLLLARAIPTVLTHQPHARFYFIGDGALQNKLVTFVDKNDLAPFVQIEFLADPTTVLARSSVFVSLQNEENYPSQSLLEAMACGNAIVATDVGETWRLVDQANGRRVAADVDAVAEAITGLLENADLPTMQQASRNRILQQHTAENFYAYISDVYRTTGCYDF